MVPVTTVSLPTPKLVRDCLADLTRWEVEVRPGEPVALTPVTEAYVGVYTRSLRTTGLVLLDLPLAVTLGGATATLPPDVVRETLVTREITLPALEGIRTVLGAASAWFAGGAAGVVALYQLVAPEDPVPLDVRALSSALGRRRDLVVRVPGYGAGRLSVVLAP